MNIYLHDRIMAPPRENLRWTPWNPPQPASAVQEIAPLWDAAHNNPHQPMTHDDRTSMVAYHRLAFTNIREGSASEETWGCLALASNLSLILAELGYGEDWIPAIQFAQAALMRGKARGDSAGCWRLDGPGLNHVAEMLDVFDGQLELAPRLAIVQAREIILQRLADNETLDYEQKERADG